MLVAARHSLLENKTVEYHQEAVGSRLGALTRGADGETRHASGSHQ